MNIQALTAARQALFQVHSAPFPDAVFKSKVADVAQFLETLPAIFAELEHLRTMTAANSARNVEDRIVIRELRDQIATERCLSDERLLKIEKLKQTANVRLGSMALTRQPA